MTQEEKDLLVKDLCGRLPYKVKVNYTEDCDHDWYIIELIDVGDDEIYITSQEPYVNLFSKTEKIKPYLYPLSSMTEEQKEIYCQLQQKVIYNSKGFVTEDVMNYVNWCYENHLDVNDLIPNDLAIDATGLNIY